MNEKYKRNPHFSYRIGHLTNLFVSNFLPLFIISHFILGQIFPSPYSARRWTELATDVFTAGLTWWTCHILTEILIERVLKTIFLLWPNWLFISPLIWPSIAIKMPAHHTEQNCLQAALSLKSNTFSLLWICSLTRKLGRKNNWEDLWKGTHNFVGCCLALSPIN